MWKAFWVASSAFLAYIAYSNPPHFWPACAALAFMLAIRITTQLDNLDEKAFDIASILVQMLEEEDSDIMYHDPLPIDDEEDIDQ